MIQSENILIAFFLTFLAGLSTGIGSVIAWLIRKPRMDFLSFTLGFSSGVMIYISFVELIPLSIRDVGNERAFFAFFAGIFLIGLIDVIIPEAENPHHFEEIRRIADEGEDPTLMRTGVFTAVAIGIHNFPEGLAAFGTALSDLKLGIFTAVAIAMHNIPEGISVSVPIYYATGSRKKAFLWSLLSGLSEPVGAAVGFTILLPFLSKALLASLLALVAGIMVYISLDELLPMAHRYGPGHTVILGVVLGMFFIGGGLLLF